VFFSKNKPVLKDLIPEGHTSIFIHIYRALTVLKHLRTACDLRVRFRALGDRDHHYTHIIQNVWDNTMKESHPREN
jgi:hypothetical protein